ncbi:hypothetical protein BTE77_26130 [Ensifer adhaerens]|nr:hypothetical protein BTE77_26130 [Ensifer adhaerens]
MHPANRTTIRTSLGEALKRGNIDTAQRWGADGRDVSGMVEGAFGRHDPEVDRALISFQRMPCRAVGMWELG